MTLSSLRPGDLRPELLAPAGDMDCARAAVTNGADAIYFGLDRFNARLRANNFTLDSLPELMRFLHAHGVRGYVTMNTLLFTSELADALTYLGHLNAAGVDGVIVQDIGLARCLTEWGRQDPAMKLELHASTQMTLSSPDGLEFAAGFLDLKQAVLARELSLEEIGQCIRHTDIPLEVFVHGALCVAYSGQCLTSESLGQRSANRGECAQACRLPYTLVVDGKAVPLGERRYLLSPQDLCALDRIPDLVRMGVKSYKIEGRLKSPEYVAAVTAAYRKALDAACAGIPVDELVTARDRYALQMVFSRGFSTGWLDGTDHPRLTHGRHGKKRGAYAGTIVDSSQGWLDIRPEGNREVDVEGRVCAGDLRTLVQRADELQVNIVEFGQVAAGLVLQVHGETGRGSVTRDHRRSHGEDLCVLDVGGAAVNLSDDGVHVILLVRTLVPVLEFDDGHTVRRTLSGDHAVAGHLHVVANLRNAADALRNLLHDLVGLGERGTRGRGDVDHDCTLVLVGNQTRLGGVHQQNQRRDGQAERRPHQPLVLDEEHHAVLVLVDQGSECRVEGLAETRREVVAHLAVLVEVRLQDHGAERRRQRKGVDGRKTHGHGHRDTELRVEDARRSAHHGDGDEHGHEDSVEVTMADVIPDMASMVAM